MRFVAVRHLFLSALCLFPIETTLAVECACAPSSLRLTLGFDKCNGNNYAGSGLKDVYCSFTPLAASNINNNITYVTSITVLELDVQYTVLHQTYLDQIQWKAGESMNYEFKSQAIAGGLQIIAEAKTTNDQVVKYVSLMSFWIDCEHGPPLENQTTVGWMTMAQLTPPPKELCPTVNAAGGSFAKRNKVEASAIKGGEKIGGEKGGKRKKKKAGDNKGGDGKKMLKRAAV